MSLRVSLDSIKGTYTGCVTSEEIRRYNGMVFDKEEAPCIFVKNSDEYFLFVSLPFFLKTILLQDDRSVR